MPDDTIGSEKLFEKGKPLKGEKVQEKKGVLLWTALVEKFRGKKKGVVGEGKTGLGSLPLVIHWEKLNFNTVNQVFAVVFVGLIGVIGYLLLSQRPDITRVTTAVAKVKIQPFVPREIQPFEQIGFYVDQVKLRNLFRKYEEPKIEPVRVVEPAPAPPPPPRVTIEEKANGLRLMGVSWGSEAKAIIENQNTNDMLFVREGEQVKGTDIQVKAITKDDVTLVFEDQEMKLK